MRSSFFVLSSLVVACGVVACATGEVFAQVAPITDLVAPTPSARTVFKMADGRWYEPRSGLTAATEQALRDLIDPPAVPAQVQAPEPIVVPPPTLFQMADGRWYEPRSGLTAATEQALRDLINPPTTPSSRPPLEEFPLVEAIRRAQSMLEADKETFKTPLATKPDWAPVRLAVWRSATNQIDVIDIEKRGAEVRGTDPRIKEVNVLLSRQLQSQYKLASDTDVVVAIRYPLYRETTAGKKVTYQREDVVYSPYSPLLHTEEMVRFGHAWLDEEFRKVADDLRARGVRSKFDPSKSLADMLSPEVARAILLIEHTDETSIASDPVRTYERMLVTVAANATTSYAYSDSHVGAQGFAQFMPTTYSLVARDKALGLPAEVQEGTRSFGTAIKAQLVYLDRLWAVMPEVAKNLLASDPDRAAEFVVAAYNGGEGRIQKASAVWGDTWTTPDAAVVKKALTTLTNAKAAVTKAKKAVTAAKTTKAKTDANAALKKANTALANAQAEYNRIQAGTLRDETIGYVAKFKNALTGIRLVRSKIEGGSSVQMANVSASAMSEKVGSE